jgi:hypothetical protein
VFVILGLLEVTAVKLLAIIIATTKEVVSEGHRQEVSGTSAGAITGQRVPFAIEIEFDIRFYIKFILTRRFFVFL